MIIVNTVLVYVVEKLSMRIFEGKKKTNLFSFIRSYLGCNDNNSLGWVLKVPM